MAVSKKKYIDTIPKEPRKEGVILFGRGPSVDLLEPNIINNQDKYDTCTLTDAIKLLKHPTYSFCYHFKGLVRIWKFVKNPKYLLLPSVIVSSYIDKLTRMKKDLVSKEVDTNKAILQYDNTYLFLSKHIKLDALMKGLFDNEIKQTVYQSYGSVVGAFHFLTAYMGYKKILYIGFDGGKKYGRKVANGRKGYKAEQAAIGYKKSWYSLEIMKKFYPEVKLEPLTEFMKKAITI